MTEFKKNVYTYFNEDRNNLPYWYSTCDLRGKSNGELAPDISKAGRSPQGERLFFSGECMEHVAIFDTTLRDGEQSPGASMSIEQKYEIAVALSRLGVDVIEAGFPTSSPHQFDACKLIAEKVRGVTITALARALDKDIEAAGDAIKTAESKRIHTFIATSPIHMKHKLRMTPEEVIEKAAHAVGYARKFTDDVEFSPEDATRSEIEFLCKVIETAIAAGASVINIPDTVGYTMPDEFSSLITKIKNKVPNIDKAVISVHCHNDLGFAVANSISAVQAGARQVEVAINGIGERAGNAALEEVVMAFAVRADHLSCKTKVNTKNIYNTSRLLSNIIGFPISRNKPIVGENAFAHEAGIHQHGVISNRSTYEIMTPESVGRKDSNIVLGRHSGLHGFTRRLKDLGMELNDEEMKTAYSRFLDLADRKREVFDDDLYAIISDQLGRKTAYFTLEYLNVTSGNVSIPTATIKIRNGEDIAEEAATGDGPINAIFVAIDKVTQVPAVLKEYNVQAVTPGKQALGEVAVLLEIDGERYPGRGSSTDILLASARAYVNAVNRYKLQTMPAKEDV